MSSSDEVCVLLGGGVDSTALLEFYTSLGSSVKGIHFDYGQPSVTGERRAIQAISAHYGIPVEKLDLGLSVINQRGEYRCRNALLLLGAVSVKESLGLRMALGIHYGTAYYDCSVDFVADSQRLFDGYSNGSVRVEAPFVEFTKREIYDYCIQNSVPVGLTFSCEHRGDRHCGQCPSCEERKMLNESL